MSFTTKVHYLLFCSKLWALLSMCHLKAAAPSSLHCSCHLMGGGKECAFQVPGRNFDAKPVRWIECQTCVSVTLDIISVLRNGTKYDFIFMSSMSYYAFYTYLCNTVVVWVGPWHAKMFTKSRIPKLISTRL